MSFELPVWVARVVGISMMAAGLACLLAGHLGGMVMGAIFGLVGLSIALARKKVPKRKCPHCAEFVKREAVVCKHRGRNI